VLYVCSPVVGITGTTAYNDAALVFFILVTFYLVARWDAEREDRQLLAAGLAAGFCYSIKFTGLLVAPAALVFVLARHRRRALLFAAAAFLMIAPWMTRNALRTGNPLAPLFNSVFPNPYFHVSTEHQLGQTLRSYSRWTSRCEVRSCRV